MQLLPSLRSRERSDLFGDFEQRLNEIRFLGVIEADAQSASFFPERHVRPLSERYQRPGEKHQLKVALYCLFSFQLVLLEAELYVRFLVDRLDVPPVFDEFEDLGR